MSVVLLPAGDLGEQLLALATEWTALGLIRGGLWVLPENVVPHDEGPAEVTAIALARDAHGHVERIEASLFEELASTPLSVVRMVKTRAVSAAHPYDVLQERIADVLRESVRRAMPLPRPGSTVVEQSSELKLFTLICAPTMYQLDDGTDWMDADFGAVVVASPEDRSGPRAGDAFVRDDGRFVGFVLLHVASLAGLWTTVSTGSMELVHRDESGSRSVWVARVFVRAVLKQSLTEKMAVAVLADAARPDSLLVDPSMSAPPPGTTFIEDSQIDGYVGELVKGALTLDNAALTFHRPSVEVEPPKRRIGFWRQLASFISFAFDKLVRVPVWIWRAITSRSYRRMTRALHSDEGASVVGGPYRQAFDARELEILHDAERVKASDALEQDRVGTPAEFAHIHTTPALWESLREVVFGALDGSADLSRFGFVPVDGAVPIFGRVSDVWSLPGEPWTPPRESVPDGFPRSVDWYALALDDPREKLEDAVREAKATQRGAESALESAKGAGGSSPDDSAKAVISKASGELEVAKAEAERLTGGLESYDDWAAERDRSFVWRLLHKLAAERRAAEASAKDLGSAVGGLELVQPGELITLRRRFVLWTAIPWTIGILFALFVIADPVVRVINQDDPQWNRDDGVIWWMLGIDAAVLLVVTLIAAIAYHVGWSRFERRIELERARIARLRETSRMTYGEVSRLRSLHKQTVDWLVLLSTGIHRPWIASEERAVQDEGGPELQFVESDAASDSPMVVDEATSDAANTGAEPAPARMPFALQVSSISTSDEGALGRARGAMTDTLVVKGWRHSAFEALVAEVARERGARPNSFTMAALDEDLPQASNHTRRIMLNSMQDEKLLARVAAPRADALVRAAQRSDVWEHRPRVVPFASGAESVLSRLRGRNRADRGWDEFLSEIARVGDVASTPMSVASITDVNLGDRYHERVESHVVVPGRIAKTLSSEPGSHIIPAEDDDAPVEISLRVDLAGPVPPFAVRLWERRPERSASTRRTTHLSEDTGV